MRTAEARDIAGALGRAHRLAEELEVAILQVPEYRLRRRADCATDARLLADRLAEAARHVVTEDDGEA